MIQCNWRNSYLNNIKFHHLKEPRKWIKSEKEFVWFTSIRFWQFWNSFRNEKNERQPLFIEKKKSIHLYKFIEPLKIVSIIIPVCMHVHMQNLSPTTKKQTFSETGLTTDGSPYKIIVFWLFDRVHNIWLFFCPIHLPITAQIIVKTASL